MSIIRLGVLGGLVALVATSILLYPQLPDMIPRSIDANGRAGGMIARSPFSWGFPIAICISVALVVEVIRAKLPTRPDLFNFPGKEQLLRLPAEYHGEVVSQMQLFMDITNAQMLVVFALVQWMLWRGAHGQRSEALTIALLVLPVLLLVGMGLLLSRLQEAVDRAQRRYDSRRNPLNTD
ncbi:DUF1648 domain-containing protein [Gemmatimonas phototrophica]|uniref:DUF1648 domain-containing protein n=1 Tax=Gemmatimonas phototrophica TaxID=1379270 RepID=A0A143BNM1_9BACT|nr:DUF1648 domain-containing protein [Gemmatimonas phototrophica]AMW06061.1 hypothetical protein GEMMAAP_17255 [Gemmatimonas phototrophica]